MTQAKYDVGCRMLPEFVDDASRSRGGAMPDKQTSVEVKTTGPEYVGWRAELLAELALARVPDLIVHKRPGTPPAELPYHFLVSNEHGLCFFVEARGFSSFQLGIEDVGAVRELRWSVDADLVRQARRSRSPFFLFFFDADTDHGRYLRLDTLPEPRPEVRRLALHFPFEQAISKDSLEGLVAQMERARAS
jgi:hypothetical protein